MNPLNPLNNSQPSLNVQTITSIPSVKSNEMETERLLLRTWNEDDISEIHSIMQDPEVNYFLQKHKLNERSTIEAIAKKANTNISEHGYGYFICTDKNTKEVLGMVGLSYVDIKAEHFPCYTVSWILKKSSWGKGLATEAASQLMEYGFKTLQIPKIYACTTWNNEASLKVMKRLNMEFVTQFAFPGFDTNDLFCLHYLYCKQKD